MPNILWIMYNIFNRWHRTSDNLIIFNSARGTFVYSFSTEWSISYAYFNVIRPPILPKNLEFDMVIDYTEWAGNLILMILDRKFTTSFDNYSDEI